MSQFLHRYDYMDLDDFEELLADKPHDEKWELLDGRVVKLMVGARWEHHLLIQNLNFALTSRLRAKLSPCRVFTETFYMKSKIVQSATLPDVMVRCGRMPPNATACDDPTVLVEVTSPGSGDRDRTEKWKIYRRLASLQHYVLIERDEVMIQVFDRAGEVWAHRGLLESPDGVLDLPAIGVSVPISEIYRDVLTA